MKFCGQIINKTLHDLFREESKLYHIGEDTLDPYGGAFKITKGLSTNFPERVITTPISEAAIVGFSHGMALHGLKPIVELMFGDFTALAFDQILNHLSKFRQMYNGKVNPKVVIRTPMGGYRGYGPTHSQSLEKYIVGIPGIEVISMSDIHDLESLYRQAIINEKKPIIIIENKLLYSSIYKYSLENNIDGFEVEFTKETYPSAILKTRNSDKYKLTIISYGGLAKTVREIVKEREDKDNVQLISITNLKNLNLNPLKEHLNKSGNILILEEGTQSFGLSAEYSFRIKEFFPGKIYRLCAKDYIIPNVKDLELEILPSNQKINQKINEIIEK